MARQQEGRLWPPSCKFIAAPHREISAAAAGMQTRRVGEIFRAAPNGSIQFQFHTETHNWEECKQNDGSQGEGTGV